jgi:hypothetical protein
VRVPDAIPDQDLSTLPSRAAVMAVTTSPIPNPVTNNAATSAATSPGTRADKMANMARQPAPIATAPAALTGRVPSTEMTRLAIGSLDMIKTVTGWNARPVENGDNPS